MNLGRKVDPFLVGLALSCMLSLGITSKALGAAAVPSTFESTVGSALLCYDQIDPHYFWSYLGKFFGPPYKREGGAYWFKVGALLWGVPVSEVMVSDGSSQVVFLGAIADTKPDALAAALLGSSGIVFSSLPGAQDGILISNAGSRIVTFGKKAKIYCSKFNLDAGRGMD